MFSKDFSIQSGISQTNNGKFGAVYLANYLKTNQLIAVKKICLDQIEDGKLKELCEELKFARQLKHPNLNTHFHSFICNTDVYILYPLMCFGSCHFILDNYFTAGLPEVLIALIVRDVLLALMYIHKNKFIHGSIKASHILLDRHKATLSCFRGCRCFIKNGKIDSVLHGMPSETAKNLCWTAPEVLDQNLLGYTEKCDIYSIGITCCELANGVQPFLDAQPTFMYTEKIRGNVPSLLDQSTCSNILEDEGFVNFNAGVVTKAHETYSRRLFSDAFHQFAEICLNRNPSSRWSAQKLLGHSFFKQIRYTSMADQLKGIALEPAGGMEITDNIADSYRKHVEEIRWDFT